MKKVEIVKTDPNEPGDEGHWQILDQRMVFRAPPWIDLSVEKVRIPDGRIIDDFYQLRLPDFVLVFAETVDRDIITIRQYKHGAGQTSITLPGGLVESGEDPAAAAARELLEETGYRIGAPRHLGSFVVNGNLGCGTGHFFAATGAEKVQEPESGDLEKMEICLIDKLDLTAAVSDGRVVLLNHAALIALAAI